MANLSGGGRLELNPGMPGGGRPGSAPGNPGGIPGGGPRYVQ